MKDAERRKGQVMKSMGEQQGHVRKGMRKK